MESIVKVCESALVSYIPDEPVDFVKLFFIEVYSFFHFYDYFPYFFIILPVFEVLNYRSKEKRILFL